MPFDLAQSAPTPCNTCRHYCGYCYGGSRLVCGMHPGGPGGEQCPDHERGTCGEAVGTIGVTDARWHRVAETMPLETAQTAVHAALPRQTTAIDYHQRFRRIIEALMELVN